ncbi:MAG: thiamine pyrophosphate-binding protein, partial [Balneolaceae bacterium]
MNKISAYRWSFHLLDALTKAGVQHAVVSPGSRSTPLTIAAADHPDLTTSIILDERSAGFFALGVGKKSGIPAVLICTSGSAVANYL